MDVQNNYNINGNVEDEWPGHNRWTVKLFKTKSEERGKEIRNMTVTIPNSKFPQKLQRSSKRRKKTIFTFQLSFENGNGGPTARAQGPRNGGSRNATSQI